MPGLVFRVSVGREGKMGQNVKWVPLGTTGGWVKAIENPVLGPESVSYTHLRGYRNRDGAY